MVRDVNHVQHYTASEGKVIVPKERKDNSMATTSIWLSSLDSIDNYEEIDEPQGEEYVVQ